MVYDGWGHHGKTSLGQLMMRCAFRLDACLNAFCLTNACACGWVQPEDSLLTALRFMASRNVSSVHVVSQNADPIGTLTFRDVCKYLIVEEAKLKLKMHHNLAQLGPTQKSHKHKVM